MNYKEHRFILIDISKIDKDDTINKISEFFTSLFFVSPVKEEKYIIYHLYDNKAMKNYYLNEIIELIKDDFKANISIFESNVLDNNIDINNLISLYYKYNGYDYMNISTLTKTIYEKNNNDLDIIKPYVLYILNEDEDYKKIIEEMFVSNLNVSLTAKKVYMHRNTIINKLDVIEKKTGLNIKNFKDAFMFYVLYMK